MEDPQSIQAELRREDSRLRASIRKWTFVPIAAGLLVLFASYWTVRQAMNDINVARAELAKLSNEHDTLLSSKKSAEAKLKVAETELSRTAEQLSNSRAAAEHIRIGINHYQRGDYGKAIAEYKRGLEIDPTNFVVYDWAGYAYYRSRNYDEAIKYLRRSVQINPRYARGYYNLSLALWRHGDHDEAIDAVEMAVNLDRSIREDLLQDGQFKPFRTSERFRRLLEDR